MELVGIRILDSGLEYSEGVVIHLEIPTLVRRGSDQYKVGTPLWDETKE